jgi:hypothetical protein
MFKGGVREQQQLLTNTIRGINPNNVSGINNSYFAFPSGWDFATNYDLTVNNNATNGHRHNSSSPNQSSVIER